MTTPITGSQSVLTNIDRFQDCFTPEWIAVDALGYPAIAVGKANKARLHRIVYRAFCGPIPDGSFVLHSCGNAGCINPLHLRLGTAKDNSDDRDAHGKTAKGGRLPQTKLSDEDVRQIRASNLRGIDIAKQYGISKSCVSNIRSGFSRSDVV